MLNDLFASQRAQYGTGLKLRAKSYGPYKITDARINHKCDVVKVGCHDGSYKVSIASDHMKPWPKDFCLFKCPCTFHLLIWMMMEASRGRLARGWPKAVGTPHTNTPSNIGTLYPFKSVL
ncbi:hypothetical protein AVEN_85497-1 [Araneus ventricosus]|uniref:Uncharacterized protein n=1 Tax=Araneus ventricosus TaxID=182803 RepID=A0A4Y2GW34_ARAVE|nr:hypothetical protein AVEN_85497-1 [Araneus ventricosus]